MELVDCKGISAKQELFCFVGMLVGGKLEVVDAALSFCAVVLIEEHATFIQNSRWCFALWISIGNMAKPVNRQW